jgi:hypothetical protein
MTADWYSLFASLPPEELDKVALLRLIECTNGVIQHLYRDGDPDALSIEETRSAMKFSMGCIKNMAIPLGDREIRFAPATAEAIGLLRELYVSGVKNGNKNALNQFFIASEANLRAVGMERLEAAKRQIFYHIYELPPHTLDWGMDYIRGFVGAKS